MKLFPIQNDYMENYLYIAEFLQKVKFNLKYPKYKRTYRKDKKRTN